MIFADKVGTIARAFGELNVIGLLILYFFFLTLAQRFSRADKRSKLPKWIQEHLTDSMCNLSTEEAAQVCELHFNHI